MSYIAADMWGEHLFYNKPVRYVHETTKRSWWIDPKHNNSISVPIGTAKLFNDAGFLYTHYVPFDKRNMCFGDNPIEIKVYWLLRSLDESFGHGFDSRMLHKRFPE